jgi:hypothetical protein
MTTIHPILLIGNSLHDIWRIEIPEAFQSIFNPNNVLMPCSTTTSFVKDIIKLDEGKYIVTFNSINSMLISLFHNLYYDTARIVISPEIYYEISIADVTKHRYVLPTKFKTTGPYKKCVKPFILYKRDVPRAFSCELNEVKTEVYSVPL